MVFGMETGASVAALDTGAVATATESAIAAWDTEAMRLSSCLYIQYAAWELSSCTN